MLQSLGLQATQQQQQQQLITCCDRVNLEDIRPSERSQSQNVIYHDFIYMEYPELVSLVDNRRATQVALVITLLLIQET